METPCNAIKLVMAKVYVRLNWDFMQSNLEALHFYRKFSEVVRCSTTTSIAIRFNGFTSEYFSTSKGLR